MAAAPPAKAKQRSMSELLQFNAPDKLNLGSGPLDTAALIYEKTYASASSLLEAFRDAKTKRGSKRGQLSDQEQDILRAALVMCCAGLDASLKQAIRDCFEITLESSKLARENFEKFIRRRISGESDVLELTGGTKFLSQILADREPRKRLVEEYIRELTGESLQSAEEILRAAAALGIEGKKLQLDVARLKLVFSIRNKIIHELDVDLNVPIRKRAVRSQYDLFDNADYVLQTIGYLLRTFAAAR